jgi:PilZ domain
MNIHLLADNQKVSGLIRDISQSGCCITTPAASVLEKSETIAVQLKFLIDNVLSEASIKAKLIRTEGVVMKKCMFEFEHTNQTEKFLSLFINHRQHKI